MQQESIQAHSQRTRGRPPRAASCMTGPRMGRRRQPWSWRKRGQAIVIFALTVTFLMGLAGLAIDVVRAYDLYAREHRAAEAGALAGDVYMPCFYTNSTEPSCGGATSNDNLYAQFVALGEVQKNGFGAGMTAPIPRCMDADSTQPVTVCQDSKSGTALDVTVTQPINVFFLSVIGISTFNVSATAAADYLPNTILGSGGGGSGGNVWGVGGTANPKGFWAAINGPAEFQEQGDPFVYCQQGPTSGPPADGNFASAATALQDKTTNTVAGFNTNHGAFPGGNSQCGGAKTDPNDYQPRNLRGPNTPAGNDVYDFEVKSDSGGDVWIWNPSFVPSDPQSNCNGAQFPDTFFVDQGCNNYYKQYGTKLNPPTTSTKNPPSFDDPRFYFDLVYTRYTFQQFSSSPGTQQGVSKVYPPIDLYGNDVAAHCGVTGGNAYLPPAPPALENSTYKGLGIVPATLTGNLPGDCNTVGGPGFMAGAWVDVFPNVPAGAYRIAIEAVSHYPADGCGTFTCGWGRHVYSIAYCASGSSGPAKGGASCTPPANGLVSPINDADLYLNFPSGTQEGAVPIADIPSSYAGKTLTFSVFNGGYTRANAPNTYFTIVPPDCSPITITPNDTTSANWYRVVTGNQIAGGGIPTGPPAPATCPSAGASSAQYDWVFAAQINQAGTTGDFIYHGMWVDISITLPSSYKNTTSTQWWYDEIVGNGSKDFGQIAIKVSVGNGSPVHLTK